MLLLKLAVSVYPTSCLFANPFSVYLQFDNYHVIMVDTPKDLVHEWQYLAVLQIIIDEVGCYDSVHDTV